MKFAAKNYTDAIDQHLIAKGKTFKSRRIAALAAVTGVLRELTRASI